VDALKLLKRVKRITNGEVAVKGQFPFSVSLQWVSKYGDPGNETLKYTHFCGGTLVRSTGGTLMVITAGHCFLKNKGKFVFVQIGGVDFQPFSSNNKYRVTSFKMHDVNPYTFDNDLLVLTFNISRSNGMVYEPVELADGTQELDDQQCFITGFGATEFRGSSTNKLNFGKVNIISLDHCESLMGRVLVPQPDTGKFCAIGNGVDACLGDSGGGLICRSKQTGKFFLRGIISYGKGCGSTAGVYQDVIFFHDWIKVKMKELEGS
jgi:secreted trypsin-like serine protease